MPEDDTKIRSRAEQGERTRAGAGAGCHQPPPERPPRLTLEEARRRLQAGRGPRYWRALEELTADPEWLNLLEREFPRSASVWTGDRRNFIELMAASLALAGLTGCTRLPSERIVPYVIQPQRVTPGEPLFFATNIPVGGYAQPSLARSNDGRPTKIEGNPQHPFSQGGTSIFQQAELLTMYDPDRSQNIAEYGEVRSWAEFLTRLSQMPELQPGSRGNGLRLLTGNMTSPTLIWQIQNLLNKYPEARWHSWEPVSRDAVRLGTQMAFGRPLDVHYQFGRADIVLSLDGDFLAPEAGPGFLRYARDYAARRKMQNTSAQQPLSRMYMAESGCSLTGANADQRQPMRYTEIELLARGLAAQLGVAGAGGGGSLPGDPGWRAALLRDLEAHRGRSLVVAGEYQTPAVQALAHAMNQALGNAGQTVTYSEPVEALPAGVAEQRQSLLDLVNDMQAGKVTLLVIFGQNPVYSAPVDVPFAEALSRVRTRIHHGLYADETAAACDWHIPESHALEAWGDCRSADGSTGIIQPLIAPLYDSHSAWEMLAALGGPQQASGYELLRMYWAAKLGFNPAAIAPNVDSTAANSAPPPNPQTPVRPLGSLGQREPAAFEEAWETALYNGFFANSAAPAVNAAPRALQLPPPPASSAIEVVFRPDPTVYDGRYNNNGWLQELPKPVTKLTWDNAAIAGVGLSQQYKFSSEEIVEINAGGRALQLPAWVQPGHPNGTVTVTLGYGRRRTGRTGVGRGFDLYALRTSQQPWGGVGISVRPQRHPYPLAKTHSHFQMEGRDLAKSATLEEYQSDQHFAEPEPPPQPPRWMTLYPGFTYPDYAWAMSIDLNSCIGCSACVLGCQSENNIPVVGKLEVQRGREMHWLRIDRYYKGDYDNPETLFQPIPCMQCEDAPCELVCPVGATVHSSEGLNDMVYNRCVGTRYCSNNCPYKVRRFNFFHYADYDHLPSLAAMQNPDVTVRSRGVMEKCTYCVQRIMAARVRAELENRTVRDGEITPACAAACPTQAIVFGDKNNKQSRVSQQREDARTYHLLEELGTRPRTSYMAKVTNPNPALLESLNGPQSDSQVEAEEERHG